MPNDANFSDDRDDSPGMLGQSSLLTATPSRLGCTAHLLSYGLCVAVILLCGPTPVSAIALPAISAEPPPVIFGTPALEHQRVGLFPEETFTLTTGRCEDCRTPPQALWYFRDDTIAIPRDLAVQPGIGPRTIPPFLLWIGSPEVIDHVTLAADHQHLIRSPGLTIPLRLVSKLPANQSFYNEATSGFFGSRPLRIRGRTISSPEGRQFEARTIWPADLVLTPDHATRETTTDRTITQLIETSPRSTADTLTTHILWERSNGSWAGKPVLGAVLNGAQGDDDEAHGGHFGIFTGRVGPQGEWDDWLVNNFYDPDIVSEKGILPAMVPMDNYLMDLNSGQSYYRPSALLVLVLKQDRIPAAYQSAIQGVFRRFYRHELDYDHSLLNCAGFSIDQLRTLGWQIPFQGPSSRLKATGGFVYLAAKDRSLASGQKVYRYFSEETTRLLPRVTFESIGNDLLHLLRPSGPQRPVTSFEQELIDDVEAVLYVHIPQIPSSRSLGTYPVATLDEFQQRVPADRSKWKTIAVPPRPFPTELSVGPLPVEATIIPGPVIALLTFVVSLLCGMSWVLYRKIAFLPKKAP